VGKEKTINLEFTKRNKGETACPYSWETPNFEKEKKPSGNGMKLRGGTMGGDRLICEGGKLVLRGVEFTRRLRGGQILGRKIPDGVGREKTREGGPRRKRGSCAFSLKKEQFVVGGWKAACRKVLRGVPGRRKGVKEGEGEGISFASGKEGKMPLLVGELHKKA